MPIYCAKMRQNFNFKGARKNVQNLFIRSLEHFVHGNSRKILLAVFFEIASYVFGRNNCLFEIKSQHIFFADFWKYV